MLLSYCIMTHNFFKGQMLSVSKKKLWIQLKMWIWGNSFTLAMIDPGQNGMYLINDHQVANGFQKTLGIGSCLLYFLPSAFQTGMIKPGWDIGKILKMLYKIFDESPAHCDVDLCKGTYKVFPIKFCSTRLIEDQPVADWAWEVWFSVVSTVKHWLSKFKQPKNSKSYDTMVEHHQDSVIPAKFYFFSFITGILKPYFVIFQSDRPFYWCLMKLVLSFIVWWGWFARKSKLTILLVSEKWWIKIFSPIKATNLKNSLLI